MNVAELERLLHEHEVCHERQAWYDLQKMTPTLARRVISAEKLVGALLPVIEDLCQRDMPTPREVDVLYEALTTYEATK